MSSSSTPYLNSLPAEILKRIASYSSCESVLSLIRCNRNLYNNCHDAYVYKSILLNHGNHPTFDLPWDISFLDSNAPTSVFARYALADWKAREWIVGEGIKVNDEDEDGSTTLSPVIIVGSIGDPELALSFLQYFPHVSFRDHPVNSNLVIPNLIEDLGDASRDGTYTHALNLLVANVLLAQYHSSDNPVHRHVFAQIRDALHDASFERVIGPNPVYLTLALLHNRSQNPQRVSVAPINPSKIPLSNMISLPDPFEKLEDGAFWSIKYGFLTSKTFLETGTWTGYYSYGVLHNATFDPPMQGIQFTVDEHEDGTRELRGDGGVDQVGHFTITGSVDPDGSVSLMKNYAQGFTWVWTGRVTPLGILGFWGASSRSNQGWFWLWKREWIG